MKKRIVFIILAVWALLLSTFATAIETDRTWYLAGEQMKVSVTADDALIAYAELCDIHGLAASVYKDEGQAYVYDAETGALVCTVDFEGKQQPVDVSESYIDWGISLFALDHEGRHLAVSFSDGSLSVYDTQSGEDLFGLPETEYTLYQGGFFGDYLAIFASGPVKERLFAILSVSNPEDAYQTYLYEDYLLQADDGGIYLAKDNTAVCIDPTTMEQSEVAFTMDKKITGICCSPEASLISLGKGFAVYREKQAVTLEETAENCVLLDRKGGVILVGSTENPSIRLLQLVSHGDADVFAYDPSYIHAEARLSEDGETVMLFRRTEFSVFSMDGTLRNRVELPDSEHIYDEQFRRENGESWLEVKYENGYIRNYSARDGALLSETQGEIPDLSRQEDFFTDKYRIHTILHEAPKVYDRATGEFLRELEKQDDLTYVTQVGEYIVTEYHAASENTRYGLLLDAELNTLARLPDLCDIVQGNFIFDYPTGDLRKSKLYDTQELIEIAGQRNTPPELGA